MKTTGKPTVYQWNSIEFSEDIPIVWMHTPGIRQSGVLKFSSWAELKELVNTLKGALNQHERETKKH